MEWGGKKLGRGGTPWDAMGQRKVLNDWSGRSLGKKKDVLGRPDSMNWWSWRELNPRPKTFHHWYYMLSRSLNSPPTCEPTR